MKLLAKNNKMPKGPKIRSRYQFFSITSKWKQHYLNSKPVKGPKTGDRVRSVRFEPWDEYDKI